MRHWGEVVSVGMRVAVSEKRRKLAKKGDLEDEERGHLVTDLLYKQSWVDRMSFYLVTVQWLVEITPCESQIRSWT